MKIKITSDCLRAGGVVVTAGESIECGEDEGLDLLRSGRAVREDAPAAEPMAVSAPASEPEPEPEKPAKNKK